MCGDSFIRDAYGEASTCLSTRDPAVAEHGWASSTCPSYRDVAAENVSESSSATAAAGVNIFRSDTTTTESAASSSSVTFLETGRCRRQGKSGPGDIPGAWWHLYWCHERCHKPDNLPRRHALARCAQEAGGFLKSFKFPSQFSDWTAAGPPPPYVLLTSWRKVKPCLAALDRLSQRHRPVLTVVLCNCDEDNKTYAHALNWASRKKHAEPVFVCRNLNLDSPKGLLEAIHSQLVRLLSGSVSTAPELQPEPEMPSWTPSSSSSSTPILRTEQEMAHWLLVSHPVGIVCVVPQVAAMSPLPLQPQREHFQQQVMLQPEIPQNDDLDPATVPFTVLSNVLLPGSCAQDVEFQLVAAMPHHYED